ncbi:hypothetical protein, partial [Rhodococcus sp. 05-340-1]|uniref:hypothetical protein n=1 Tax=Rhodococcus sp. 05-340-1 TaxID=2022505 RepID=UPI001C52B6B0
RTAWRRWGEVRSWARATPTLARRFAVLGIRPTESERQRISRQLGRRVGIEGSQGGGIRSCGRRTFG